MNILTNTGPQGTATTMWSAKVDDLSTLTVKVNAIVGSTITVESAPDNATWTAVPVGVNLTSGAPGTWITNGQITAVGKYQFHINNTYIRVRVSTYVGPGNVDIDVDYSVVTLRTVMRPIDTALTAIGTTQATALPLQAWINRFATVAASSCAILPDLANIPNLEVIVRNTGANALTLFPPVGKSINGQSANTSLSVGASAVVRLVTDTTGNFWSL